MTPSAATRIGCSCTLLLAAAACSPGSGSERAQQPVADAAPYAGCRGSPVALPWERPGKLGRLSATVIDAAPAQPARYDNVWTVDVAAAELASAETFMPVHDHAGVPPPALERAGTSAFRLSFDFMMRGPWELRLNLENAAGPDQVVFELCVAE